tara:strand:- start:6313 stop:7878 length:1566 start_codon:yes stop_codon:yes gene_type:complete
MKKLAKGNSVPLDQSDNENLLVESSSNNLAYRSFEKQKATDRLHQILPTYRVTNTPIKQTAKAIRFILLATIPVALMVCLTALLFIGYRAFGDFETFWHHLRENKTFAVSLSDDKTLQDVAVEDVLARLESTDKSVHQKLAELAAVGYDSNNGSSLVIYDEKKRAEYRLTYEQQIQLAITQAYEIYNQYDPATEASVFGVTTENLIYQKGLKVSGYAPMTLRQSLYEGRRYFAFALIAGQLAGIDPLRLLKIFEIESNFTETAVGSNRQGDADDDIGIAQNNLVVIPGLIREMLNPNSKVYCPYFEFLSIGEDLETKQQLSWSGYLVRLESELDGSYHRPSNPSGRYYINLLKAPHISAILAAYHIKRDQYYGFQKCVKFYQENAKALKKTLNLKSDIDPYHWTDYSFYNGGPTRWRMIQNYLKLTEAKKPVGKNLQTIVRLTKHRNLNAQKIGSKNEALRQMTYDIEKGQLVENDGGQQYGLYGFCETFSPRQLMYNLSQQVAESPIPTQVKNRSQLETQ